MAGHTTPHPQVQVVEASGRDLDADLPGSWLRIGTILDPKLIESSVLVNDDGLHGQLPSNSAWRFSL